MTSSEQPVRGPVGMPAHLWELARSDVRTSVPSRIRGAVANGLNAPDGVRRIAARVAATGAALGVPAALFGLGAIPGSVDTPVGLAGGESPLDGLDGAPAMPGSAASGSGGSGEGGGDHGGFASTSTSGAGDVHSGLGSTWHVQDPSAEGGDWLTVQMYQDVTVTETADGMFVVDAWQYVVIRDDDGHEYVFKEHYQVIVPDPPGEETDIVVHERGSVHVVENPDGSFSVVDTDFGIDVLVGSDGDGRDEVGITQTEHVRYTDTDGRSDDHVVVDLSEKATSTSEDTGDEATTTIGQDQVFDDRAHPSSSPFGERPAGTPTTTTSSTAPSGPAGGTAASTARQVDAAPLATTLVAAPETATVFPSGGEQVGAQGPDVPAATSHAADAPFGPTATTTTTHPFEPPVPTTDPAVPVKGSAPPTDPTDDLPDPSTPDDGTDRTDNTPETAHESPVEPVDRPGNEHDGTHGAPDVHGHDTDGADPALVS